jgi:hypothetical protein
VGSTEKRNSGKWEKKRYINCVCGCVRVKFRAGCRGSRVGRVGNITDFFRLENFRNQCGGGQKAENELA